MIGAFLIRRHYLADSWLRQQERFSTKLKTEVNVTAVQIKRILKIYEKMYIEEMFYSVYTSVYKCVFQRV